MAKPKKPNAAQRRAKKQAEKLARALYAAGKVAAKKPQNPTARRKQQAQKSKEQSFNDSLIYLSSADFAQASKKNKMDFIRRLRDEAYRRYKKLIDQGTPNAATAVFETEFFAGIDPEGMSENAMRATFVKLQKWLRRKDVSAKSAQKRQEHTLDYPREHGFPDVTADDLEGFFDTYARFLEYHGYGSRYFSGRIAAFTEIYAEYETPLDSMQEIFERADEEMRREYERNNGADTFGGIQLSPGGGLQSPNAPGIPAQNTKRPKPSRPDRKQRRKTHAQTKARKSARVSARKKRKRKKR